ncbi:acyl-CoA dehydrogenase family protein [Alcaligenaceae bacterium]|nr:acyl-CoA dehydrogenase family protein [Alcaligenaceae bacterium]
MSLEQLTFPPVSPAPDLQPLRFEVRRFLREQLGDEPIEHRPFTYLGRHDPAFSAALGARGWVGMSLPRRYGGREASVLERYTVFEELLAARAPMGAHAVADRQSGPLIDRIGTDRQKALVLPGIAAGTCYFCIGMSEPDSGSDLASVRTRATRVNGGWHVNGSKIWTSSAHRSHYMILLCRTSPPGADRHAGLSQFLVDMRTPGVECRPLRNIAGENDFNEVVFTDAFIPDDMLLGNEGDGWGQVTSELALERSGPERFLSGLGLMQALVRQRRHLEPTDRPAIAIGRMMAHLHTLRRMSLSVAGMLQQARDPVLQAAIVKDLGTVFEQETAEILRLVHAAEPECASENDYTRALAETMLRAPSCTIRGGTKEVLRGIIARSIGLR